MSTVRTVVLVLVGAVALFVSGVVWQHAWADHSLLHRQQSQIDAQADFIELIRKTIVDELHPELKEQGVEKE